MFLLLEFRYNNYRQIMQIMAIVIKILEALFVIGLLGSAVVILLSGVEDIETALEPDEPVAD
jgi:hypothetical protein